MFIHDLDWLIDDRERYSKQFEIISGRPLKHAEWIETKTYLSTRHRRERPKVYWKDFKAFSELYDEVHPYEPDDLDVPMLARALWAKHVCIITPEELEVVNRLWRIA